MPLLGGNGLASRTHTQTMHTHHAHSPCTHKGHGAAAISLWCCQRHGAVPPAAGRVRAGVGQGGTAQWRGGALCVAASSKPHAGPAATRLCCACTRASAIACHDFPPCVSCVVTREMFQDMRWSTLLRFKTRDTRCIVPKHVSAHCRTAPQKHSTHSSMQPHVVPTLCGAVQLAKVDMDIPTFAGRRRV